MSKKTVKMVLNRNYTLSSTLGHVITFKKDVPMDIPAIMVRSCAEIGAERVDGETPFEDESEEQAPPQPVDPGARIDDIKAAIEKLVESNQRDDFTAAGTPSVSSVSDKVGYKVDRAEVLKAWFDIKEDEQRVKELGEDDDAE